MSAPEFETTMSIEPYSPRQILRLPLLKAASWDLKQYAVVYGQSRFNNGQFREGLSLALSVLPAPACTNDRLGVGFIIFHQGKTMDYVVLAWWDRENELPLRVFVSERNSHAWRRAQGSESICVWDLEIIWRERNAFVETILGRRVPSPRDRYLETSAVVR